VGALKFCHHERMNTEKCRSRNGH